MRRYEQVFILRPSLSEDQISKIIENTAQLVEKDGGSIIFLNKWGMRKLAYPIKKEAQGYYVLCDFAASAGIVAEIERRFRIDDSVLKYLTIKLADNISSEEIEAAKSEAEEKAIAPEPEENAEPAAEDKSDSAPAPKTGETKESEKTDETESVESEDNAQ
ncbi:MAG: 30S ribosomal protein S6 [Desulfofustis sp.]|jgi:small subunit ribosomal protein S6